VQEPDSFPEGRAFLTGLHKRSAEDKGGSCARQGRSPSGRLGFLAFSSPASRRNSFVSWQCRYSREMAKPNWYSAVGRLPRICRNAVAQDVLCRSASLSHALLVLCFARHTVVAQQPVSRLLQTHYKAADGTWVRCPRIYKRRLWKEQPTATCCDGSLSFAHSRTGSMQPSRWDQTVASMLRVLGPVAGCPRRNGLRKTALLRQLQEGRNLFPPSALSVVLLSP
jgi:hypothetical protein